MVETAYRKPAKAVSMEPIRVERDDVRLALAENSENLRHVENQRFVILNGYFLLAAALIGYALARGSETIQAAAPAVVLFASISTLTFFLALKINIESRNCREAVITTARALGLAAPLTPQGIQSKVGTKRVPGGWKTLHKRAAMESHLAFSLPFLSDLNEVFLLAPLKHLAALGVGSYVSLTLFPLLATFLGPGWAFLTAAAVLVSIHWGVAKGLTAAQTQIEKSAAQVIAARQPPDKTIPSADDAPSMPE